MSQLSLAALEGGWRGLPVAPPPSLVGETTRKGPFWAIFGGLHQDRYHDGGQISQERLQQPPFSKICRSAYEFGIERCVFPFSRGTGCPCIVSKDSAALYGKFLNSRIEKKKKHESKRTLKKTQRNIFQLTDSCWNTNSKPIFCFTHILVHDLYIFKSITNKRNGSSMSVFLLLLHIHIIIIFNTN